MSKKLRKKTIIVIATIIICMACVAQLVFEMQKNISFQNSKTEIEQQASRLPKLLETAKTDEQQNTETYDAVYQSKADSIAFIAKNNAGFEATDTKMADYKQLLEVDNVMVVERSGNVVAKAQSTLADFSHMRFNDIKCALDGQAPGVIEVTYAQANSTYRYYSAAIDSNTMVVVEQNPSELNELNSQTSSTQSVLQNITVGSHGYVMAISAQDYVVSYHPDSKLVGADALEMGINVENLENETHFECNFAGENLYCGVVQIGNNYYVFAVPETDMLTSRLIAVGVILFAFLAVMVAIALYGIFVLRDDEKRNVSKKVNMPGAYCFNIGIAKKALALSIVGFLVVVGVCFYMQTLFALSSQSVINNERATQISQTIKQANARASQLEQQYSQRYLDKCRVAAHVVSENPSLATHEKLAELADVLQIAAVYAIDGEGNMTASSTPQKSYSLSTNPNDSSYAFRALLAGTEELVQPVTQNDSTGESQQFIGVATRDSNGYANGLVQIAVRPQRLEKLLESVQIDHVLSGVKAGVDGFAFAVNASTRTIDYYPNDKIQGKSASSAGISDSQLKSGYTDYITIGNNTYFATCTLVDNYYLFVAGSEGELMAERGPLTQTTALIAFLCLAFIFVVLSFELKQPTILPASEKPSKKQKQAAGKKCSNKKATSVSTANENKTLAANKKRTGGNWRIVDVTMADGHTKQTESAASRWFYKSLGWHEKTPEQKLGSVMRWFMGIAAFVVCASVLFKSVIFPQNSVIAYILSGAWPRGFNIFAITASIMYACVALTFAAIVRWVLHLLADVLGTRGETVCRLLSSGVKYGTVIFMLYWCLGVLGVDTATLLASAGIITLALSFGAKDLVSDILCGLFIILEGEFRVGDVIQVGSQAGTVMDIGVRTTKIKNGNGDVLVLRNSGISNVVNKTKLDSYANVDVILPTGESLAYLENLLSRELPHVAARVPEIIDGPFYKGVVNLAETTITVRVVATCKEKDRGNLERSLKREMKLLLAHGGVAPFADVAEHDLGEGKTAEERKREQREQKKADTYIKQQEHASEAVGNESASGGGE